MLLRDPEMLASNKLAFSDVVNVIGASRRRKSGMTAEKRSEEAGLGKVAHAAALPHEHFSAGTHQGTQPDSRQRLA
jgi:hypothetical protein